jgi:hypothetical protein
MGHLKSFRPVTTTPNIMTATHDQYRIWRSEQFPSERFDEWLKIFRPSGLDRFTAFTRMAGHDGNDAVRMDRAQHISTDHCLARLRKACDPVEVVEKG